MTLPAPARCAITGAASGFGRALSIELASRGAHLVLSDLNVPAVEETASLAVRAGAATTRALRCDVTRLEDVEEMSRACEGRVDLLVNNAGVACGGRIGELSLEDWRWTLDANLLGVIHGVHVFVPRFRSQASGHVLNVASAAGFVSPPGMAAYNVSKAGVIALSETLAAELAGSGVAVTVLCPTFFRTNLAKNGRFADAASRALGEQMVAGGTSSEVVARAALASVARNQLFAMPMRDGRWAWRLKRLFPAAFVSVVARRARLADRSVR